jgi:integrase/recombinase XerD
VIMKSASDPSRVRMSGPVVEFMDGLVRELQRLGYATTTSTELMRLAAHLSRWLEASRLGLVDLTSPVIDAFVAERRKSYVKLASAQGLDPILGYLRRVGAVPAPRPVLPTTTAQVTLAGFAEHLRCERGLSSPVVAAYAHWVRPFVEQQLCPPGCQAPRDVTAGELVAFLAQTLPALSGKSAQMTATALRSMLRFGHAQGWLSRDLRGAVPPVAQWRLSGLPRPLTQAQVLALLQGCDPTSPVGSRDRAVIVLMRRLALRSAEVAALRLEDVDWVGGTVLVRGKGGRVDRMPLPVDVGQALVSYLRDGRPPTRERTVFVRAVAPFTPLGSSSVSCIVGRAARRAGLGTVHGHRLRHTAASETLNAGAGLDEVAQLLRHDGVASTVIYAKVERTRLTALARPWPGVPAPSEQPAPSPDLSGRGGSR